MAVFTYKAIDARSAPASGTVVADTPRQARDQLRDRGLSVFDLTESWASGRSSLLNLLRARRHGRRQFVAGVVRELATLLGVGMPMLDAIQVLAGQRRGWQRRILLELRDQVAGGASLASAMREHPKVFSPAATAMVAVGEDAGTLDEVLEQLADFGERSAELRGRVTSALIYPALVGATGVGVTIFLMSYVVPSLLETLTESGRPLPTVTQIVKLFSDGLLAYGWFAAILTLAAGIAGAMVLRLESGRLLADRLLLRIPLLGKLLGKHAMTRIAFVIATLMKSGVSFEQSVGIAARSIGNRRIRAALDEVAGSVRGGQDIAPALEATGAFDPVVVQVFALGQHSSRLEYMLERLSRDYDRQVSLLATRFTSAIEPILIVLLACIIGVIAFATILPILEMGHVL